MSHLALIGSPVVLAAFLLQGSCSHEKDDCAAVTDPCVCRKLEACKMVTEPCYCPSDCEPGLACVCGGGKFLRCEKK